MFEFEGKTALVTGATRGIGDEAGGGAPAHHATDTTTSTTASTYRNIRLVLDRMFYLSPEPVERM